MNGTIFVRDVRRQDFRRLSMGFDGDCGAGYLIGAAALVEWRLCDAYSAFGERDLD